MDFTCITVYLVTEPIVTWLSLWVGFAWGVIYLFTSSVLLVYTEYGFSPAVSASMEA